MDVAAATPVDVVAVTLGPRGSLSYSSQVLCAKVDKSGVTVAKEIRSKISAKTHCTSSKRSC